MAVPFRPSSVALDCSSCLYSADGSEVFAQDVASGAVLLTDRGKTNTRLLLCFLSTSPPYLQNKNKTG